MSTRSTTHFIDSSYTDPKTNQPHLSAIIYRHSDGYPEGAGMDIYRFLARVARLRDNRLDDVSYLAAKYVVFLAEIFASSYDFSEAVPKRVANEERLDFLSVGVMMQDPGDIQYRYVVDCGKIVDGLPEVKCFDRSGKEHDIPRTREQHDNNS